MSRGPARGLARPGVRGRGWSWLAHEGALGDVARVGAEGVLSSGHARRVAVAAGLQVEGGLSPHRHAQLHEEAIARAHAPRLRLRIRLRTALALGVEDEGRLVELEAGLLGARRGAGGPLRAVPRTAHQLAQL